MLTFNKLTSFINELTQAYNVNYGGCCYLSYLIASELEKQNINYSFTIQSNRKITHNRGYHYCIYVYNYGYINKLDHYYIMTRINVRKNYIRDKYYSEKWSKKYSTSYNKLLEVKIKEFFIKNL